MSLEGKLTWTEMETVMSMQDVLEYNEMYDTWASARESAQS